MNGILTDKWEIDGTNSVPKMPGTRSFLWIESTFKIPLLYEKYEKFPPSGNALSPQFKIELRNIRWGAIPASFFAIPEDYRGLEFGLSHKEIKPSLNREVFTLPERSGKGLEFTAEEFYKNAHTPDSPVQKIGKFYVSFPLNRARAEIGKALILLFLDSRKAYVLNSQKKIFLETSFIPRASASELMKVVAPDPCDKNQDSGLSPLISAFPEKIFPIQKLVSCQKVGEEIIDGISTDKWRIEYTYSGGTETTYKNGKPLKKPLLGKEEKFLWIDQKSHLLIKEEVPGLGWYELREIRSEKLPAALFAIPPDYKGETLEFNIKSIPKK